MEREPRQLDVSVVVFHPDPAELRPALESLRRALAESHAADLLSQATLWLIDNGSADPAALDRLVAGAMEPEVGWLRLTVLRGHGNVGYGRGHDLALADPGGAWHLVLNPDVVLAPEAITEAVRFLEAHPEVGLVTPHAVHSAGGRQYLCKRYPSVLVLALRGFAPHALRRRFQRLLDRYEMRDLPEHKPATGIPIASGCFMFARRSVLRAAGGFSARYFMYFEDFDLSLRLRRTADIAYVPKVRITHGGGAAARKGWLHQRLFIRSALTFFGTHGWRLW
ncbi:MAG: glycosyltransferase family 2 protein [Gemmatimonadales bacterium]|nr:glycosyltransferase family 2 protein [Gemmatimonadales bacterium]MBA3553560.1 glycosyltransferase family 2 protein [Gemmatimonadales bacterium]